MRHVYPQLFTCGPSNAKMAIYGRTWQLCSEFGTQDLVDDAIGTQGLGSIWSWPGEIRTTQKNIGVSPNIVTAELGAIAIESE
jgi:hypothetical protein